MAPRNRRHAAKSSFLDGALAGPDSPTSGSSIERIHARSGWLEAEIDDRGIELASRLVRIVRIQDAGLGLDHLTQCPEADAVAVGEASTSPPPDQGRELVEVAGELADQPRLADPGFARDEDDHRRCRLRVPGARSAGAAERLLEHVELRRATHERWIGVDGALLHTAAGAERLPHDDRCRLAFREDGRVLLVDERRRRRAMGRLADQHAVDGCGGLQASARVHDVARYRSTDLLAGHGRDQRFAGVHADPRVEVEVAIMVEVLDRLERAERRADRTLGVILVGDRHAEDPDHPIAQELLDRAAVSLGQLGDGLVVGTQGLLHVLGVHPLRASGELDEVAEDHRDDLALLAADARRERRTAAHAEVGLPGILGAAAVTDAHGSSIGTVRRGGGRHRSAMQGELARLTRTRPGGPR